MISRLNGVEPEASVFAVNSSKATQVSGLNEEKKTGNVSGFQSQDSVNVSEEARKLLAAENSDEVLNESKNGSGVRPSASVEYSIMNGSGVRP